MQVVHINASDRQGGAALAAYRLHQALREQGVASRFLTLHKCSQDETVEAISTAPLPDPGVGRQIAAIQDSYIDRNRTEISIPISRFP